MSCSLYRAKVLFKSIRPLILLMGAFAATPLSAQTANTGYEWFWREVPARAADGERTQALELVTERMTGRGATTRMRALTEQTVRRWREQIEVAAHAARVSEALIAAIVTIESSGEAKAVSPVGAQGLGQLMPGTALTLGVRDSFNPMENLRGAALYISDLIDLFDGDLVLALASYNAGEGAVMRHRGVPPYRETRAYVPKVLEAYAVALQMCSTPARPGVRSVCQFARPL